MHRIFLAWFLWGFFSKVIVGALVIFAALLNMCESTQKFAMVTGAVSCGLYGANAVVWIATGAIWRYSKAGMTAAGDTLERPQGIDEASWDASVEAARVNQGFQIATGRFMKIYLLISGILIATLIIGTIWFATVMACCSPVKEYNSLEEEKKNGPAPDQEAPGDSKGKRKERKPRRKEEGSRSGSKSQLISEAK